MSMIEMILTELEQESQTTKRLLERVPEDKLGWKPHPKSYSLGQLAMHIASLPARVAMAAMQDDFEVSSTTPVQAVDCAELLDTLVNSLVSAKEILSRMDDARLMTTWNAHKNGKIVFSVSRMEFLRAILLNHSYHHRGQLSVYLRMLNVPVPPIYGPSADETPWGEKGAA